MESKLKFSVLMSVYEKDNPDFFKEALDSVINQTRKPDEIVVVEDGPLPEAIKKVLSEYKNNFDFIKSLGLEKNAGLGAALQKGLEHCSFGIAARMDSDDISLPDRFAKQIKYFENDRDLSVLGGCIEEVDAISLKPISRRSVPLKDKEIKKRIKYRSPFNHVSVMFKKDAVLKTGGYRSFYFFEDYDLWTRLTTKNFKLQNMPDILVLVRIDNQMYKRRGGWKYFKSCKALQDELLKLKIISFPRYAANIIIRFTFQVLMPNSLRSAFYKIFLR
jgi:glycosyltransferase involved in cell wall biosynthesis